MYISDSQCIAQEDNFPEKYTKMKSGRKIIKLAVCSKTWVQIIAQSQPGSHFDAYLIEICYTNMVFMSFSDLDPH